MIVPIALNRIGHDLADVFIVFLLRLLEFVDVLDEREQNVVHDVDVLVAFVEAAHHSCRCLELQQCGAEVSVHREDE